MGKVHGRCVSPPPFLSRLAPANTNSSLARAGMLCSQFPRHPYSYLDSKSRIANADWPSLQERSSRRPRKSTSRRRRRHRMLPPFRHPGTAIWKRVLFSANHVNSKGRAKKRLTYTRRFVNVTLTGGKRKVSRPRTGRGRWTMLWHQFQLTWLTDEPQPRLVNYLDMPNSMDASWQRCPRPASALPDGGSAACMSCSEYIPLSLCSRNLEVGESSTITMLGIGWEGQSKMQEWRNDFLLGRFPCLALGFSRRHRPIVLERHVCLVRRRLRCLVHWKDQLCFKCKVSLVFPGEVLGELGTNSACQKAQLNGKRRKHFTPPMGLAFPW